jgi:hypothetical protein
MRLAHVLGVVGLSLVLGAPAARAQDTLETSSGSKYTGKIVSNDGTSVEIETADGKKLKLPYDGLTPMSQYGLQLAKTTDDGQSQLDLADWCVGKTLYPQAKIHFRKALTVAPTMEDAIKAHLVIARKTAAEELLARGKRLQTAGKNQEARQVLSTIVQELPLEDAAKEASQLLAAETAQRKDTALKRAPKPSADKTPAPAAPLRADGEPFSDATRALFDPIVDSYRKMLDATQDGLKKGSKSGEDDYEKALKEGDKIRRAADKLRPQGQTNPEIAEALDLVDTKLEEAEVDARINLANDYLIRTSYNNALEAVNLGLADYPKNERLLQARAQVGAASASNGGGDWVIVGGGRR